MSFFTYDFLKFLKKTLAVTLFLVSAASAMSDTEKERLQEEELLSLRAILTMEDLAEEERKSLVQQIQNLASELHISILPTPTRSSSAPASSSSPFFYVEKELERLCAMTVKDDKSNDTIKLLEAAQKEGIKKYRTLKRLRRIVILSSKDPSSIPDVF